MSKYLKTIELTREYYVQDHDNYGILTIDIVNKSFEIFRMRVRNENFIHNVKIYANKKLKEMAIQANSSNRDRARNDKEVTKFNHSPDVNKMYGFTDGKSTYFFRKKKKRDEQMQKKIDYYSRKQIDRKVKLINPKK